MFPLDENTTPLLVAKNTAVLDFMRRGKHPGAFSAEVPVEHAAAQSAPPDAPLAETHCGICLAELPESPLMCDCCDVFVCRACAVDRCALEGPLFLRVASARCVMCVADMGGDEEVAAREEAVASGLAGSIGPAAPTEE